jgi:hypothetical protein
MIAEMHKYSHMLEYRNRLVAEFWPQRKQRFDTRGASGATRPRPSWRSLCFVFVSFIECQCTFGILCTRHIERWVLIEESYWFEHNFQLLGWHSISSRQFTVVIT